MALGEHVEVREEVVEHADDLGRREPLASGVKSTTSANRIDAELNWSAIVWVWALSRSAIDRGRMLSSRLSALDCSSRNAASASRRWLANTASSVKTIVPPTVMLRASIVLVNHTGTAGDTPPSSSPAMPEPRNTTTHATYQRTADRTSLNTSAPSGARIPHRPTPPESRKPPSGTIDSVGANRIATWPTKRNWSKFRVREKTTMAASRTTK